MVKSFLRRLAKLHKNRYIPIYVYRKYKYNVYPKISTSPHIEGVCVNRDGVKYEIIYKHRPTTITFNKQPLSLLEANSNQGFILVSNSSGELKIDHHSYQLKPFAHKQLASDATIIISDRYEKADDNGEFFYQWIIDNQPQFENVYFAISKKSSHYPRLQNKGFKLLDMDSRQFRRIYKNADIIASSVFADYIENHRSLRYKFGMPRSRFICLKHGVSFLDSASPIWPQQKMNYMNSSLESEKELLISSNLWFESQIPVIGMPRINAPTETSDEQYLLYSPTWTMEAFNSNNIEATNYYQEIKSFINNPQLVRYLQHYKLKLKLIIHPQLIRSILQFKKLQTEYISVYGGDEISYKHQIKNCQLLITDASSIFFDAFFYEKNVIFYQPDLSRIRNREKYYQFGNVCSEPQAVVELLVDFASTGYQSRVQSEFMLKEKNEIETRLWELVING